MNIQKVSFKNKNGQQLVGRLELPVDQKPHNYALFAHCFTCTKNLMAVKNVGRALTQKGFGVLRFDFTGLGESEGDFENTNFSGNVADLVEAADFLKREYGAPALIIGHSLGGSAAIFAAEKIAYIKAVAVINSPSHPSHVLQLLKDSKETIAQNGKATVNLGGRDFTIKKQFLDDLENKPLAEIVKKFRRALLILHSPQDQIVGIKNAENIYRAAHHPKSFITLDGADHLLSNTKDSLYAGSIIGQWASRYVEIPPNEQLISKSKVAASLNAADKFTTYLKMGDHSYLADEPTNFGGENYGPTPYEFLSAGLAACTVMTLQMYAKRKKWPLQDVVVHINHSRQHAVDCEFCEDASSKIDTFTTEIQLKGDLDEDQISKLMEIAHKCPVHKTLTSRIQIITSHKI